MNLDRTSFVKHEKMLNKKAQIQKKKQQKNPMKRHKLILEYVDLIASYQLGNCDQNAKSNIYRNK